MRLVLSSASASRRRGRSTRSTLSKNAATILITEGDDTSSIAAPLLDHLVLEKPPSPLCSSNNEKKTRHEAKNSRSRSNRSLSRSTRSRSLSIRHSRSKRAQTKTNCKKNKLKSHSINGNHDATATASPLRRPRRSTSVPAKIAVDEGGGNHRYEIDKAVARSYIERLEKQLEERDEAITTLLKKNEKMKDALVEENKDKMRKQRPSDKQVSKKTRDDDHKKKKKKSSRHDKKEETSSLSAASSAGNKKSKVKPAADQKSRKQAVDKKSSSRNSTSKHRSEDSKRADNTKRRSSSIRKKKTNEGESKNSRRNGSVDIDSFMTEESTILEEGDCDDYMMESVMGDIDYYTAADQKSRKQAVDKKSSSRNSTSKHRSEDSKRADNTKRRSSSIRKKKTNEGESKNSRRNGSVDIDSFMTEESTILGEGDCDDYMMESAMGDIDYYTDTIIHMESRSNRTRKSSKSTKDLKSVYVPKKKDRSPTSSSRDDESSKKSQKEQHRQEELESLQLRRGSDIDSFLDTDVDVDYHRDLRKKQEYNNKVKKSRKWETKQSNSRRGSDPDMYLVPTTNEVKPKRKDAKKKLSNYKKKGSIGCDPDLYLDTTTPGDVDFHTEEDRFTESVARTSLNCSF